MVDKYPDELSRRDYYDSLLDKGPGDPDKDMHYPGEKDERWVGKKPKVEHHHPDSELSIETKDRTLDLGDIPF